MMAQLQTLLASFTTSYSEPTVRSPFTFNQRNLQKHDQQADPVLKIAKLFLTISKNHIAKYICKVSAVYLPFENGKDLPPPPRVKRKPCVLTVLKCTCLMIDFTWLPFGKIQYYFVNWHIYNNIAVNVAYLKSHLIKYVGSVVLLTDLLFMIPLSTSATFDTTGCPQPMLSMGVKHIEKA